MFIVLSCLVVSCPVLSCRGLVLSSLVLVSSRPIFLCVGSPWATILHPKSCAVGPLGVPLGSLGASWGALSAQMGPRRRPEVRRAKVSQLFWEENGPPRGPFWDHCEIQKPILIREVSPQGAKGRKLRFANTTALWGPPTSQNQDFHDFPGR